MNEKPEAFMTITTNIPYPIRRFEILVSRNEPSPEFKGFKLYDRDIFDLPGEGRSKDLVIYESLTGR